MRGVSMWVISVLAVAALGCGGPLEEVPSQEAASSTAELINGGGGGPSCSATGCSVTCTVNQIAICVEPLCIAWNKKGQCTQTSGSSSCTCRNR